MAVVRRRAFLGASLGVASAARGLASTAPWYRMGIGTAAYMQRARADRDVEPLKRFTETMRFLEHCRELGAEGIQAPLSSLGEQYAARLRENAERYGMCVEVSARLPGDDGDSLDLFERSVKATKAAGGAVIRTVMLGGRRYETFKTVDGWREFSRLSWRSLTRAEPILRKHGVQLALENQRDWRIDEMLSILKRIDSKCVGVTVDTGNNMSLLEDPLETARTFAPCATSMHLKDMGIEAYEDGFLIAEVPFGEGRLDLEAVVDAMRAARPEVRFTLEMITRDPLEIPCLRDEYRTTMGRVPGRDLAAALRDVRIHGKPLQRTEQRPLDERLRIEEDNNISCLEYGKRHLGL